MCLKQIHAGAECRQPILFASCVADTELGDEAAKTPVKKKKDIAHRHDSVTDSQRMIGGLSHKVERGAYRPP